MEWFTMGIHKGWDNVNIRVIDNTGIYKMTYATDDMAEKMFYLMFSNDIDRPSFLLDTRTYYKILVENALSKLLGKEALNYLQVMLL